MAKLERVWLVAHEDAYCAAADTLAEKRKASPAAALGWLEKRLQKLGANQEETETGLVWTVTGEKVGPRRCLSTDLLEENGPAEAAVLLYLTRFAGEHPERMAGTLWCAVAPGEAFLPEGALRIGLSSARELGKAGIGGNPGLADRWDSLYGSGTAERLTGDCRVLEAGTQRRDETAGASEVPNEPGIAMTYVLGVLLAGLEIPD